MSKENWCIECGRRIGVGDKICHHCCATQSNIVSRVNTGPFNTDIEDLEVLTDRYKDLLFKQATDGLSHDELNEMRRLAEYLNAE